MIRHFPRKPVAAGLLGIGIAAALGLAGCSQSPATPAASEIKSGPLQVFATTGYLADAVKNIAPDAEVFTMVGPGGDPHTYQPKTSDIEKMQAADVVLWNGLHLEAQMLKQLAGLGDKQLAVGDQVPAQHLLPWPEKDDEGNDLHDPHIWNSHAAWTNVVEQVGKKLGQANPAKAQEYTTNAQGYIKQIDEAYAAAHKLLDKIPAANRFLVTGHDAFNYLGKDFNLKIEATDFVSSESEKSATQIDELAAGIAQAKVPMIFLDNLQNPQAIKHLQDAVKAKGWEVKLSDQELFADTLGDAAPVDTYLGAFNHNIAAIAAGLGG